MEGMTDLENCVVMDVSNNAVNASVFPTVSYVTFSNQQIIVCFFLAYF